MQDYQIVDLYWERDERAIKESEANYGKYCRSISINLLNNQEDAEECVNDTWLSAWNSIPPNRPTALSAFFGRIVRNLSISRFRANRAGKRYDGITVMLSELDDCVPSTVSVSETMENGQITQVIESWLNLQSKDDRALFIRRYWHGEAVVSLAKESNVTQNQMAQRMLRLRQSLKKALEKEEISL
ncbi:MAG: RNA polymerase sigma factor [Clostridiales bacterium]|nr:RNA polymerase sigma factor [Clostridiales bacterium]